MRMFMCASALALAAASAPAMLSAQDMGSMPMATSSWTISPEQQAMIGTWPMDRQTAYNAWASPWQEYYWSLTPNQQTGWWALTDDQRTQLYAMTPVQRAQAWTSIEAQLAGATPSGTMPATPYPGTGMAASPASPGMVDAGPPQGKMTPPPASAMNKSYPVCSRTVQDNCRNRGGV